MDIQFLPIKIIMVAVAVFTAACNPSSVDFDHRQDQAPNSTSETKALVESKTSTQNTVVGIKNQNDAIQSPFAIFKKRKLHKAATHSFTLVYEDGCLYGRHNSSNDGLGVLLAFEEGYAKYNHNTEVLNVGNRYFKLNEKIRLGGGFIHKNLTENYEGRILFMPQCEWDTM